MQFVSFQLISITYRLTFALRLELCYLRYSLSLLLAAGVFFITCVQLRSLRSVNKVHDYACCVCSTPTDLFFRLISLCDLCKVFIRTESRVVFCLNPYFTLQYSGITLQYILRNSVRYRSFSSRFAVTAVFIGGTLSCFSDLPTRLTLCYLFPNSKDQKIICVPSKTSTDRTFWFKKRLCVAFQFIYILEFVADLKCKNYCKFFLN